MWAEVRSCTVQLGYNAPPSNQFVSEVDRGIVLSRRAKFQDVGQNDFVENERRPKRRSFGHFRTEKSLTISRYGPEPKLESSEWHIKASMGPNAAHMGKSMIEFVDNSE